MLGGRAVCDLRRDWLDLERDRACDWGYFSRV